MLRSSPRLIRPLAFSLLFGASAMAVATSASAQSLNTSQVSQTGTSNNANVDNNVSGNSGNSSTVIQNGFANQASVYQRATFNRSYVQQIGVQNSATHEQAGSVNAADTRQLGDFNKGLITQVGDANSGSVTQQGYYNGSTVRQGYALDETVPSGESRRANNNLATVDQNGAGLGSLVEQRANASSALPASDNFVSVVQRSSGASQTVQQESKIRQESRGNSASVEQYDGSTTAPNSSSIVQRSGGFSSVDQVASNSASIVERGSGQKSEILQDGARNRSTVSLSGGGQGSLGNSSTTNQTGTDLAVAITAAPVNGAGGEANSAQVEQTGNYHQSTIYQFGTSDIADIAQGNVGEPVLYGAEAQHGSAFVSQNASANQVTVEQRGDNAADVTQGFGGASAVTIYQTDAGELGAGRALNNAVVAQYGQTNDLRIEQNSINAAATAWQKVGSANNSADVRQGAGATGLSSTTTIAGFTSGPGGAGSQNLSAAVTQAGGFNSSTVFQDGANLSAVVEQQGAGSANFRNLVFVSQSGGGNSAKAFQGSDVGSSPSDGPASGNSSSQNGGASADEFYFAGGSRSAEIVILQTSTGNNATASQFGKGQLARIEQSGSNNVADILQEAGATNATAVIRQSGSNNSYSVVQSAAGQYALVTQTGQGNAVTTIVTRP
jgi:hypothetical protein